MSRTTNPKFTSISKKLLLAVVTTSSIVTFVLSASQIYFEYQSHSKTLSENISSLEVSLLNGVSEKLWNMDIQGLKSQLAPVFNSIDASSIKVFNEHGEQVFNDHKKDFEAKFPFVNKYIITHGGDDGQKVTIGRLEVEFFRDKIVDELKYRSLLIVVLNAIKTAIVACILLWVFHRIVAKPIKEISQYYLTNRDLNNISAQRFNIKPMAGANDELTVMIEQIRVREAVIEDWSKKLAARVQEAEHALEEADETIQQEKLRAEASARLAQLGEMAASIAHEINNPLTIIVGYNYLIRSEVNKNSINVHKINDTVALVEKTTLRISKIISGLRTYARNGDKDQLEQVEVAKLLEDTIAMTETKLRMNGVKFHCNDQFGHELSLRCRSVQIVQVLVAMINNAVDAIENLSDRWISVNTSFNQGVVRFEITDSGNGISPEVVNKLFEPFFTTKPIGVGTGLGLSISYGIINDHGGKIFVDQKCRNTRFVIELPGAVIHQSVAS